MDIRGERNKRTSSTDKRPSKNQIPPNVDARHTMLIMTIIFDACCTVVCKCSF